MMDLLKQELERKRKAIELAKKSKDVGRIGESNATKRTYFKAADVKRFQEKQEEEERRKDVTVSKKKKLSDKNSHDNNKGRRNNDEKNDVDTKSNDEAGRERSESDKKRSKIDDIKPGKPSNELANESSQDNDISNNSKQLKTMSSLEITDALRELGVPVWLFGERTDTHRLERLRDAQESRRAAMAGISEMDEFRLGSGHGIRNTFIGKSKDDDLELKSKKESSEKKEENQQEEDDSDDDDPHKAIHCFFKNLLRQWEDELANRSDFVKRTATGKNETKTLKQCKDYIRPLFKLCKARRLEENIMGSILKIVNCCKEGEFVRANDAYMDVAIGRAAWPIGVTMVGIHQRTGRERINADKVAHVMNSELQRKYLTSVKRLITYCQKTRPDVAPSKKVTNR